MKDLTLISRNSLAPLIIDKNYTVTLELGGESILIDSEINENDGVIYIREDSKLIIKNYEYNPKGYLNIIPNKLFGIKGENLTSLSIINGITLKIASTSYNAGGIYMGKNIIFEYCNFYYDGISGKNHAIEAEGLIMIISGRYYINSENGKGIKAKENVYIGKKDSYDSELLIDINSSDEGIESKDIEIFSGNINITGKNNGITATNDICKNQKCFGNCKCYIKFYGGITDINSEKNGIIANGDLFILGGKLQLFGPSTGENQPIKKNGIFRIKGGIFLYGGNNNLEGLNISSPQTYISYNKYVKAKTFLRIYDNYDDTNLIQEIISMKIPKNIEFFYFNYPGNNLMIKFGDKEITNSNSDIRVLVTSESETGPESEDSTVNSKTILTDKKNNQTLPSNANSGKIPQVLDSSKEKADIENTNNNNICNFIRESNIILFLFGITLF